MEIKDGIKNIDRSIKGLKSQRSMEILDMLNYFKNSYLTYSTHAPQLASLITCHETGLVVGTMAAGVTAIYAVLSNRNSLTEDIESLKLLKTILKSKVNLLENVSEEEFVRNVAKQKYLEYKKEK